MSERNKFNTGYACYVGTKRCYWDTNLNDAIESARQVVKTYATKNRFVPSVTIFDCAAILIVGFVTDDANGITFHRRNAVLEGSVCSE